MSTILIVKNTWKIRKVTVTNDTEEKEKLKWAFIEVLKK